MARLGALPHLSPVCSFSMLCVFPPDMLHHCGVNQSPNSCPCRSKCFFAFTATSVRFNWCEFCVAVLTDENIWSAFRGMQGFKKQASRLHSCVEGAWCNRFNKKLVSSRSSQCTHLNFPQFAVQVEKDSQHDVHHCVPPCCSLHADKIPVGRYRVKDRVEKKNSKLGRLQNTGQQWYAYDVLGMINNLKKPSVRLAGRRSQMLISLFVLLMPLGTITEHRKPKQWIFLFRPSACPLSLGAVGLDGHIFHISLLGWVQVRNVFISIVLSSVISQISALKKQFDPDPSRIARYLYKVKKNINALGLRFECCSCSFNTYKWKPTWMY